MKYTTPIIIPYGQLQSIIEWCSDNCKYDWNFSVVTPDRAYRWEYVFEFEDERDYVTFCVWKK